MVHSLEKNITGDYKNIGYEDKRMLSLFIEHFSRFIEQTVSDICYPKSSPNPL